MGDCCPSRGIDRYVRRAGRSAALILILSVLAASASSCAAGSDDGQVRADGWPVVGVEAVGCGLVSSIGSGIGFAIDELVLTTAHTVAGSTGVTITDANGQKHVAAVRYFDPTKDIAALGVAGMPGDQRALARASIDESVAIASWQRPAPGEERTFQSSSGTVSRRLLVTIEDIWVQGSYERDAIEVDLAIESGDSGGPVLNDAGDVVGMVYAASREREVAFALDDGELALALDAARLQRDPVDVGRCA